MYTCVFSRRIQFQNCTDFWVVLEFINFLSKMPFVRQQRLDGSGPEACCSCTRVHGNQRWWLAKLLRPQFGHGCSLCNGPGLCSAPGEALSNPSRLLQKNPWVSAVSVFSFRAFTRCHFTPQWVLQILAFAPSPFSWPVCWCLCLPSFSQFTVAPCHVLITSGCLYLLSFSQFTVAPCQKLQVFGVWCR